MFASIDWYHVFLCVSGYVIGIWTVFLGIGLGHYMAGCSRATQPVRDFACNQLGRMDPPQATRPRAHYGIVVRGRDDGRPW